MLLGDPNQSPGGVADGQRAHRTLLLKAPIGLRAPTAWYMPHEIPGVFHMLLRQCRGFGLSDLEEMANAVGHRPLGSNWFRPEKVKATSSFACQLQSTYKDLSRVDLDLPEGLLVGLGYAATSPDSPLDFRQAQNAAERSGVASPHRWSPMLPTSARVAQEVYEPLIGIQYPMLRSRMGDTSQIGTTSIREDHLIASGLRFVHWCHASANVHARHNPKNDPTVRVYQHLEDQLTKAGADTDDILALTTTREGATNLRNYFTIGRRQWANTSSADEDDCLSNHPAPPEAYPAHDEMPEAEEEARSTLLPQNGESPSSSPTSHSSESPIKRRPGSKASAGRAQSKKLRKSLTPASRQPLGSIPEHEQPPATLADLASRNAQRQEAPVCRNPETPPDHPGATQESSHTITEIDLASDQEQAERGGTAATDLQLESEQRATQALYDYQHAARTAIEADGQSVPLPSLQTYSDLPRMADGETCNFQQAN